jgi:hypothetical protein
MSCGIPFLLVCNIPLQFIFCLVRLSDKSGEEKKLSVYSLCLYPTFFVKRFIVACVVISAVAHILSFPK